MTAHTFKVEIARESIIIFSEEMLGLDAHERFSEAAETAILTEAIKTSYEEASKVIPSKSKITKTTVMNKVHGIADVIPFQTPETKKKNVNIFLLKQMKIILPNNTDDGRRRIRGLSAGWHIFMNISRRIRK
ncbi:MAG: hypothetical protein V8S01_05825 [Dorea sp.]